MRRRRRLVPGQRLVLGQESVNLAQYVVVQLDCLLLLLLLVHGDTLPQHWAGPAGHGGLLGPGGRAPAPLLSASGALLVLRQIQVQRWLAGGCAGLPRDLHLAPAQLLQWLLLIPLLLLPEPGQPLLYLPPGHRGVGGHTGVTGRGVGAAAPQPRTSMRGRGRGGRWLGLGRGCQQGGHLLLQPE